ncbi:response regulator transcription factor [Streptomyces sp. NPDC030392]|uniref:response regulator transcription factor n=1 Tax=Streptomyces sp. NPDC030392 TaxID=3155468 RepID=UPI0033E535DC
MGIVDGQPLSRAGLRAIVESQHQLSVVAEGEPRRAISMVRNARPDVLVAHFTHGFESASLIHHLRTLIPPPAILVIAEYVTESAIRHLLARDIGGILVRHSATQHLPWAVPAVAGRGRALSPEIARAVIGEYVSPSQVSDQQHSARQMVSELSPREKEVLHLIGEGLSNRVIAEVLNISPETVKDHVRAVFTKLRAGNRVHAARVAWEAEREVHLTRNSEHSTIDRLAGSAAPAERQGSTATLNR